MSDRNVIVEARTESAPPPPGGSQTYRGYVDSFAPATLNGWAVAADGEPCSVSIAINGRPVAHVTSDQPRPDLADQGISRGLGGWFVNISRAIVPGDNRIEIRLPDGAFLEGSPFMVTGGGGDMGPPPPYRGEIDTPLGTVIRGWAATGTGDECEVLIRVNDGAPIAVRADRNRPDLLAQGLSKGAGGWRYDIGDLLEPGRNQVHVTFTDGAHLPNSPFEHVSGVEAETPIIPPPPGLKFRGAIDSPRDADLLHGWAAAADGSPCLLTLQINDRPPLPVVAGGPRPDLRAQGLSHGAGGWQADIGSALAPGRNVIRLSFPDGSEMPGSPIVRQLGEADAVPQSYRGAIDGLDGALLRGWATTGQGEECTVAVSVDGQEPIEVAAALPRPDLLAQGLSRRGGGGWAVAIEALLGEGVNRVEATLPDGSVLPGSPVLVRRAADGSIARVEAEPPSAPPEPPAAPPPPEAEPSAQPDYLSLAQLDELSLDDLSLAVAAGLIDIRPPEPRPEPEADAAPEAAEAPEPAAEAPARRRGFFSRLLGAR